MHRRCLLILAAGLVFSATGDAGDELSESERKARLLSLRRRAGDWLSTRKGLVYTCARCKGRGWVIEIVYRRTHGIRRKAECPTCEGRTKVVPAKRFRKLFYEMKTPAFRRQKDITDKLQKEYDGAARGTPWPSPVLSYRITRVELDNDTHGTVWRTINKDKTEKPMRWVWTEKQNGRSTWFVYDESTDGAWPTGDGAATTLDEREAISWEEWYKRAAQIRKGDGTSLAKLDTLQKAAQSIVVEDTVKIVDIVPAGEGARIVVCQLNGGTWRGGLDVSPADLDSVKAWRRWDRLIWRIKLTVHGLGHQDLKTEVLFDGLESVTHEPDPGFGRQYEVPAASPSWLKWRARFRAEKSAGARWTLFRDARVRPFVDQAIILVKSHDRIRVRLPTGETRTFVESDPQAVECVDVGDRVKLLTRIDPSGTVESATHLRSLGTHLPAVHSIYSVVEKSD